MPADGPPTPSSGNPVQGHGGVGRRTEISHQNTSGLSGLKLDAHDNRLPTVRMGFHRESNTNKGLYKGAIRLLSGAAGKKALPELMPHIEEAQRELNEQVGQVALAVGECGPVERSMLLGAAWQVAYGRYAMAKAAADADMRSVLIASKLLDSARAAMGDALAKAVMLSKAKPKDEAGDVLDAYMEPEGDE